ncbi:MFS transporter [Kitasatospora sp. LaBMicrA B282]|uniref:MFS transporter n=1 Tax=Kitasatospora sp. LaBMicrA B282 TaxID=3420949 RepID=UPI003D11852F
MSSRAREAGRSTAHHAPFPGPATTPGPADPPAGSSGPTPAALPLLPLAALFTVGYLPAYLVPTIATRLSDALGLTDTQAGGVGSALLLASAAAGIALAGRVGRLGSARLARAGLALVTLGFALAAGSGGTPPLLVAGCVLGGLGAGAASAVAGTGLAGTADPHRASVLGLLATSLAAAGLYLLLPHLGGSPAGPFLALAALGPLVLPLTSALPGPLPCAPTAAGRLPNRSAGLLLAATTVLWAVVQNALWGVSGQIGLHRVGFSERGLGLVFAVALGGGLVGVLASGVLGSRVGRVLPLGLGTAAIAGCVALSAAARSAAGFAGGEVLWNALYPLVLTYLLGLAAELDPAGRWTVLVGAASALGVAGGPLAGATMLVDLGCPLFAVVLGGALLFTAVPLVLLARTFCGRPPGEVPVDLAIALPIPVPRAAELCESDPTAATATAA